MLSLRYGSEPDCFSLFVKVTRNMYLRSTILICVIGAGGFFLFQQTSIFEDPRIVVNPHVEQETAHTVGDTSTDKVERWWPILLGGLVLAIVAHAVIDRWRFRRPSEKDFVYHVHPSVPPEDEQTTENTASRHNF